MDRLDFAGGSYSARSVIANDQVCLNYFPEANRKDSPNPWTLYQRPGLRQLTVAPVPGAVRCFYQATNGFGYTVIGQNVYKILANWTLQLLGQVTAGRMNPCSMIDNGALGSNQIILVDGSANGWTINMTTDAFAQIVDGTGTFTGADRVDILDTYVIWNMPGTWKYGSTLSGLITFNGLYFAAKSAYPDPLQTLIVNRREILLLGKNKSEIWYNAGNANFPFAELPGAYIEHGISAKYSVASSDISVFWLGEDLQGGSCFVFRQRGYETKVVSNYAISNTLQKLKEAGITISDAIGFCFSQGGHTFYVLTFPTADQTWVYDDSISDPAEAWHQWSWMDNEGVQHRHRANCFGYINGTHVVGDWQNGAIYAMDRNWFYDSVNGTDMPIKFMWRLPHLLVGRDGRGMLLPSNGLEVLHTEFWLNCETGTDPTQDVVQVQKGNISLRWSDDRGKTWGNALLRSAGELGQYRTRPRWTGLGMAMDRVYEVSHSIPGPVAIGGAWVKGTIQEKAAGGRV